MTLRVIASSMGLMLGASGLLVPAKGVADTNIRPGATNQVTLPSGKLQGLAPGAIERTAVRKDYSPPRLAPGVYKSSPFTCIVIVPNQVDDRISVRPSENPPVLPIVKPELNLTPLRSK